MEQKTILVSGVQLWNKHVVDTNAHKTYGKRIAFCSSLAVFVFDVHTASVINILAGYEGLLMAIKWNPINPRLLASASQDGRVVVWDLKAERRISVLGLKQVPTCLDWLPPNREIVQGGPFAVGEHTLITVTHRGNVMIWNTDTKKHKVLLSRKIKDNLGKAESRKLKDRYSPTTLRCNPNSHKSFVACGYKDGRIEIFNLAYALNNDNELDPVGRYFDPVSGKEKSKPPQLEGDTFNGVSDLQWDPCSPIYLLAAYSNGSKIVLWDCENEKSPTVIQTFGLTNRVSNVVSLSWQAWAPGNFMTVSEKGCGLVHVWNVSQKKPLDMFQVSSGSSATSLVCNDGLCLAPLENGAVCVYDAPRKLKLFTTNSSHRETVFDIEFSPDDPDKFATCSFDGCVKIWDGSTMRCKQTLKHDEKPILYCVTWAPRPFNLIASCAYSGHLTLWNPESRAGKPTCSKKIHRAPVYRVDWNRNIPELIATTSGDKTCAISVVNLGEGTFELKHRLQHPDKVYGCHWCPFTGTKYNTEYWVATGNQDGIVRIWDCKGKPFIQMELEGHQNKIFNVLWNPLKQGVLASGSDDHSILIWHLPKELDSKNQKVAPSVKCVGHTSNVRALLWSSEYAHILYTGSWDGTIRIWNAETGLQLSCTSDHHADVYGLHAHPSRPFSIVSSSRDTTVRFWQTTSPDIVKQAQMGLLAKVIMHGQTSSDDKQVTSSSAALNALQGPHGMALVEKVDELKKKQNNSLEAADKMSILHEIFNFFEGGKPGLSDLWALIQGKPTRVIHNCDNLLERHSQISLHQAKNSGSTTLSANAYVLELCKLGDFRTACEYLKRNKQWERALAIAPAVSREYWKTLMQEYSETLLLKHDETAVEYLLAAGETKNAIDFYRERAQFNDAMLIVQVQLDKKQPNEELRATSTEDPEHVSEFRNRTRTYRDEIARQNAKSYLEQGHGVLAACCLLAIGDTQGAIHALLLACEEPLAFVFSALEAERTSDAIPKSVIHGLASMCERSGSADLALSLYRQNRMNSALHLLCSRVVFPPAIRTKLVLRQANQYIKQAEESEVRGEDLCRTIELFCASGDTDAQARAVRMGVNEVCEILQRQRWDLQRAIQIMNIIQSVDLINVMSPERNRTLIGQVLALSCFTGLHQAIWRKYDTIVLPMFRSLISLLKGNTEMNLPFNIQEIMYMQAKYIIYNAAMSCDSDITAKALRTKARDLCDKCLNTLEPGASIQEEDAQFDANRNNKLKLDVKALIDILDDKSTPTRPRWSCSHRLANVVVHTAAPPNGNIRLGKRCLFNGAYIKGPAVLLNDKKSNLRLSDAVLWSKINPYAPINDGSKIFQPYYSCPAPITKSNNVHHQSSACAKKGHSDVPNNTRTRIESTNSKK